MGIRESVSIEQLQAAKARNPARRHITKGGYHEACSRCGGDFPIYGKGEPHEQMVRLSGGKPIHVGCRKGPATNPAAVKQIQSARANTMGELDKGGWKPDGRSCEEGDCKQVATQSTPMGTLNCDIHAKANNAYAKLTPSERGGYAARRPARRRELGKGGVTEPSEELAARGEIGETEKSMQAPLPTKCKGCGAAVDPKWGMCTKNCGSGNMGSPTKKSMGDKCMDCGCDGHVMGRCKTSLCKCNSNRMKKGTYVRKQLKKSVVLRRKLA